MKAQLDILDSMIFSKMKNYVLNDVGVKHNMTDNNFSSAKEPTDATFPYVFITRIRAYEVGNNLEADEIIGGNFIYQITVYDNDSQYRAKDVMDSVVRAMKSMMFKAMSLPIFADTDTTHVQLSRFERNIFEGDEI